MQRSSIQTMEFEQVTVLNAVGDPVFDNLTMSIPLAKFCWVKGSGGSGRSVFLKLLNGLITPNQGTCKINGDSVNDMDFVDLQKFRLNMGYSFDMGGLLSNRTLFENMLLPLNYHAVGDPSSRKETVRNLFETFKIDPGTYNSRPSEVQGSIRKTVCVARAFVLDPEMVFLDDPTAGMNAYGRLALKECLKAHFKKNLKHVFVTCDDVDFWRELIDEVLIVEKGQVKQSGGIAA